MPALDDFLRHEIDVGSFPGASYAVGTFRGIEREAALGNAVAVPLRIPATTGTIYDCASITKPLITTTLVLQLVAERRIRLEDAHRGFTIESLLTHTSGLQAWLPLYALGDYVETILAKGRETEPGTRVIYSDLNFVLLHDLVEGIVGDYSAAARDRIFEPLGLEDATFRPAAALRPRIAATEWAQRYEAGMCASRSIRFSGFRTGLIWGETHDGNSHHAGGTIGNAGLFATARDVFRIAQAFATGDLVPAALVAEATRNRTAHLGDDRALGWQSAGSGPATQMLPPSAFGHTGFTGTSVWIDPESERIMVL
ncbi:MAG: serine hydrolase domain-containing protein, partial [Thermoanaerobaculia bacterium]